MRKKKNYYSLALLSALTLFGCSQNDLFEESRNSNNAICFSTQAGKQTRAPILDGNNVKQYSFGLYAFYTGQSQWSDYTKSENFGLPNFMNNQEVKYESNEWKYDPLKYWPNTKGDKISFFAYMPMGDVPKGNASTTAEVDNTTKLPKITFTQEVSNAENMVDFVVSHKLDQTKTTEKVVLPFKHVLTRLNFAAKVDGNLKGTLTSTKVFVTGLRVLGTANSEGLNGTTDASDENPGSRFFSKANYTLSDDDKNGKWDTEDKVTTENQVASAMSVDNILKKAPAGHGQYNESVVAIDQAGIETPLLKDNQYLFLIPPYGKDGVKSETDIRIQVDYAIVTTDVNLDKGYSITSTSATMSMPNGTLIEGKAYNVILTIGLEKIRLEANLSDWDKEENVDASSVSVKATENTVKGIKDAWEKLNDYKAVNPNNNYFKIIIDDVAKSDYNLSSTVALYNFEEGDQVELKFTSGTVHCILPTGWTQSGNILKKTSARGWYVDDLTGAKGQKVVHILDENLSDEQLITLENTLSDSNITTCSTDVSPASELSLYMDNLTGVGDKGFSDFSNLKELFLPKVTKLGANAFANCPKLISLAIATDKEVTLQYKNIGADLFGATGSTTTVIANIKLTVGKGVSGINSLKQTWTTNTNTYVFGENMIIVKNPSEDAGTGINLGQEEIKEGNSININ